MTWHVRYHPVCEYCGDVFQLSASTKWESVQFAKGAGWQAFEIEYHYSGPSIGDVPITWVFYCPTHLRDDDDGSSA